MSLLLMFVVQPTETLTYRTARPKAGGDDVRAFHVRSSLLFPPGVNVIWRQSDDAYFISINGVLTEVTAGMWIVLAADGTPSLFSAAQFDATYDLVA